MLTVSIQGFTVQSEEDIKDFYLENGYNQLGTYIEGDYLVILKDGDKCIYVSDFAGTQSLNIPRNHTIVVKNNEIIFAKENHLMTRLYYNRENKDPQADLNRLFRRIDEAVKIRCVGNPVISMSSGHDSGTIAASALSQKLKFDIIAITGIENLTVLQDRIKLFKNATLINSDGHPLSQSASSISGHTLLAQSMLKAGKNTLITGMGADEYLLSKDYQLFHYFRYQEMVDRVYRKRNIQLRYPLLDPKVYFAYHFLQDNYKIKKKPLIEYMKSRSFPYADNHKRSFILFEKK